MIVDILIFLLAKLGTLQDSPLAVYLLVEIRWLLVYWLKKILCLCSHQHDEIYKYFMQLSKTNL